MKVVKSIKLTSEEVEFIKTKNTSIASLKDLFKEFNDETPKIVVVTVLEEMAKAKLAYDGWFADMQSKNNVITTASNAWNVDFELGELQLMG